VDAPGSSALTRLIASMEVVLTRRQREREAVEDEVGGLDPVALGGELVDPLGDAELPVRGASLALLVDRHADDGGAVLAREAEHPVEACALAVAVLEVRRVEDRLAPEVLKPGLHHLGLGRVEHERDRRLRGEARRDLVHVGGAVAPDVVDADVEHVRPLLDLLPRHLHAGLPVLFEQRLAELLRAVRVGALAHDEERRLLVERHVAVDRRAARLVHGIALERGAVPDGLDHPAQVLGRGAAAPADDVDAELAREPVVRLGELVGREVVVRLPVDDRRQARVRQGRQERARVLRQVPEVLGHLARARRAVQPDDVGPQRLERGERGADLGANQHAAGQLHRHLHHQRHLTARLRHGAPGRDDGGLALEQVVDRLHQEHVDAPGEQALDLRLVAVAQLGEADGAQRGELGAGTDRADHPAGPVRCRVPGCDLLGDASGGLVEREGLLGDAVLGQDDREGAERRGLDRVHADLEERPVHLGDDVGPGEHHVLVAALERRAAEVVGAEVLVLHPRPERPVEDQDAVAERGEKVGHRGQATGAGSTNPLRFRR
jgi:hypothetical protein